ncbi:MAG TPA: sigma-70 family RNA polymerase sigma factor [Solirubrobacteraceae bacterium]|jgi:RNA polymerase sigma factor (sigma-70 family)|nr:sigma-70 family RNA polymerase sigma factor [Solirubrobacteraceae bacterium]
MLLTPDDYVRLYRRHAQTLLLYFQRRVYEPELARDLLAETFEAAIAGGPGFRGGTEEELSGWLWSIARNTLADQRRREQGERGRGRRLARVRVALSDREIERVEELAGIAELREAVAQHLSSLPEEQREAVRMRVLEDLPYNEIAVRMAITPQTARARVSRGLRTLNVALRDQHQAWRNG